LNFIYEAAVGYFRFCDIPSTFYGISFHSVRSLALFHNIMTSLEWWSECLLLLLLLMLCCWLEKEMKEN